MAAELDHIFILTTIDAPGAARLVESGLTEGAPNTHLGQGTACRRFFFDNAYLELVWVHDEAEAKSEQVRPTRLWDRWLGRDGEVCSMGFCFRPGQPETANVPFAGWEYRPPYLPNPLCIHIASNVDLLTEPMLCYLAFAKRSDRYAVAKRQPLEHPAGLREITRAELVSPHADSLSPSLRGLVGASLMRLRPGTRYLVELGFDGESQGNKADCRPELPLVLYW
jgi:hypothetical protein